MTAYVKNKASNTLPHPREYILFFVLQIDISHSISDLKK